jgi:recombination protein RecT
MNETTMEVRDDKDLKFSDQLARKEGEFAVAIPRRQGTEIPLIAPERFVRALLTTVSMYPKLLRADRRSFWDASSRSAIDGLLPDGREAALVPFENRRQIDGRWTSVLTVQYIPMIGGYRRLVREAGIDWHLRVVHAKDQFEHMLGDEERISHKPSDDEDPGPWTHVYAIAKRGREIIARDVMNRAAVFRIRDRSQGWQSMLRLDEKDRERAMSKSAWVVWEEEMALKTVAKRQVKVLPLSTDSLIYEVFKREEADERGDTIRPAIASVGSLSEKMRALADQREAEALAEDDGDDGIDDIDQDGDVVDKQTGEITRPAATAPSASEPHRAAAAPEEQASSSSSQKAVSSPEASGATNTAVADTPQPKEPKAPDAPTAVTAPAADAPAAGAGPVAYTKLTIEQAAKIRKFADMLMGAQSQRTVQKGAINFLEDESFPEGSAAELAVVAIRDAHLARAAGKSSPGECDAVRDRVTRL